MTLDLDGELRTRQSHNGRIVTLILSERRTPKTLPHVFDLEPLAKHFEENPLPPGMQAYRLAGKRLFAYRGL